MTESEKKESPRRETLFDFVRRAFQQDGGSGSAPAGKNSESTPPEKDPAASQEKPSGGN